jgi:pyruvate dehydrogenase E2 component (dihydrolipoamide acetyltransferase)
MAAMPKFIEMPKLSDTMTEGTLAKWTVKEGDKVTVGKAIADIETDKATMEYASPFEGVLHKFIAQPGGKVPLGAPLAVILEDDEAAPANLDELIAKAQAAAAPAPAAEKPSASPPRAASAGPRLPQAPQHKSRASLRSNIRVKASPLAKKIAAERGVDLTALVGSGPGGRIVREDVENAPVGGSSSRVAATPAIRPTFGPEDERVTTSSMRNIIAERLLASKTQIPHFYLQMEVDAGPLMEFRAHLNATSEKPAATSTPSTISSSSPSSAPHRRSLRSMPRGMAMPS